MNFRDRDPPFYDSRTGPDRRERDHARELEALGYKITLDVA